MDVNIEALIVAALVAWFLYSVAIPLYSMMLSGAISMRSKAKGQQFDAFYAMNRVLLKLLVTAAMTCTTYYLAALIGPIVGGLVIAGVMFAIWAVTARL